jgi:hypothetical protein
MKVKWLVEPEVFKGEMDHFVYALEDLGVEHVVVKFGVPYDRYLKLFKPQDCVVFHGSFQLAKLVRHAGLFPGVWGNLKAMDCLNYYPKFGIHLLNYDYLMLRCGSTRLLDEAIEEWEGAFVRPTTVDKTFPGGVYGTTQTAESLYHLWNARGMTAENVPVIVARPKTIHREWRLVVAAGKVVSASQYKPTRQHGCPDEVYDYVKGVLDEVKYHPDPVWVLDVAEPIRGHFAVLEVGPFSCSGLYQCDPHVVIPAVNKMAEIALNMIREPSA